MRQWWNIHLLHFYLLQFFMFICMLTLCLYAVVVWQSRRMRMRKRRRRRGICLGWIVILWILFSSVDQSNFKLVCSLYSGSCVIIIICPVIYCILSCFYRVSVSHILHSIFPPFPYTSYHPLIAPSQSYLVKMFPLIIF